MATKRHEKLNAVRSEAFGDLFDGPPTVSYTDAELEYKRTHGADALIDRMSEVKLPWVFDEADRPPLV
jgi:hypothetical protein